MLKTMLLGMKYLKVASIVLLLTFTTTHFSSAQENQNDDDMLDLLPGILAASKLSKDHDGDGYSERQGDCNDTNPAISPGSTEICGDDVDQDCSGADKLCPYDIDDDGDGYTENQGDCNDTLTSINPEGVEVCGDGIDQDCNGHDEACSPDPAEAITGIWTTALTDNDLLAFIFFADGTYVHLEVDEQAPIDVVGETSGMEWGIYTKDSVTEELTFTKTFDRNGDTGPGDATDESIFAQVSGDVLTLQFDYDKNGSIDGSLDFSRSESSDLLGVWTTALTDNDLLAFIFFADGTYVHLEVDEQAPIDVVGETSGMEWGTYTKDSVTEELTFTKTFDRNGDTGPGDATDESIFAQVSGDVLTLQFDYDKNGSIDGSLDFQRQ